MIVDSREKKHAIKRILEYFDEQGIRYEVSKLLFGDYKDYNNPGIVIDRKQNILELSKNCTSESDRFRREMDKAKAAGAKLVILVEQDRFFDRGRWVHVQSIKDLVCWSSDYTQVRGEKIYRVLFDWCRTWPIEVEFCSKQNTGKRIVEIIYGDGRKK